MRQSAWMQSWATSKLSNTVTQPTAAACCSNKNKSNKNSSNTTAWITCQVKVQSVTVWSMTKFECYELMSFYSECLFVCELPYLQRLNATQQQRHQGSSCQNFSFKLRLPQWNFLFLHYQTKSVEPTVYSQQLDYLTSSGRALQMRARAFSYSATSEVLCGSGRAAKW